MNLMQRVVVAVGLLLICVAVLFPSWEIGYSNHAGLDRWKSDVSGSPIQEQLWDVRSVQSCPCGKRAKSLAAGRPGAWELGEISRRRQELRRCRRASADSSKASSPADWRPPRPHGVPIR